MSTDQSRQNAPLTGAFRSRKVELTVEDTEVLRRLAPFASRDEYRAPLSLLYVSQGLAWATDAYSIAFAEVDTDETFQIPAQCARWLPDDDVTVTLDEGVHGGLVASWEVDGGTVGGTFNGTGSKLDLDNVLAMLNRWPHRGKVHRAGTLTDTPLYQQTRDSMPDFALLRTQGGDLAAVDRKFLRRALDAFGKYADVNVAFSGNDHPIWFWDEDLTVLLMPIRLSGDLYLHERSRFEPAA